MVEFALVSVLLVLLLFAVLQVALYFYVRTISAASAADGARYASVAGRPDSDGGHRAAQLLAQGASVGVARGISCQGVRDRDAASGYQVTSVRCHGHIRSVFAPLGGLIGIDVAAHSLKEGT